MISYEDTKYYADKLPHAIMVFFADGKLIWANKKAVQLFPQLAAGADNLAELIDINLFLRYQQDRTTNKFTMTTSAEAFLDLTFLDFDTTRCMLLVEDTTHLHYLEMMRQDFVANVSHELRTPLTVIHGYLETLLENEFNATQSRQIYERMFQQSFRMERLIADLLLLAGLETEDQREEATEKLPVAKLIKSICAEANILSGTSQHEINTFLDEHLTLLGFETELESAFSNLIFNAVKYTPAHGIINVYWYKENDKAIFKVTDTGIGIAEKHIPRLTERFYRVDKARSRDKGGTGLGLAIVKHVLLRYGGVLSIDSKIGIGSTFTCEFTLNSG